MNQHKADPNPILYSPNDEEQAFSLNHGAYYFAIQVGDGYYDYTIYYGDYHEFDGGQLDEPDMPIGDAVQEILEGFNLAGLPRERCDYDELQESVMAVEMQHPSLSFLLNNAEGERNRATSEERSLARKSSAQELNDRT